MSYNFSGFELDEQVRELRFRDREIFLQPRVFNLLVHLVRNRDRVIGKDELLDAVWPGRVVTEGSIQRAISLARSALQEGGLTDAIRTYSRQGYRFCGEVAVDDRPAAGRGIPAELDRARLAYEQGDWEGCIAGLRQVDRERGGLEAVDLERWAYAVQCTGRLGEAVGPLQRSVAAHSAAGDRQGAARAALFLSHIQFEERKFAVARGWHQRAIGLLAGDTDSREAVLAGVLAARFDFVEGRLEAAAAAAGAAHGRAQQLGHPDVDALALLYQGHALLSLGRTGEGMDLLDVSAAMVLSGQVSPLFRGLVYCGVISGCRNLGDWQRAGEWNDHFTRWCEHSDLFTYSGSCRMHRAEILGVHGELDKAEQEILEACRLLPVNSARTEGEARRILGDLRLATGDLDGAGEAFRQAYALGVDPQPGYALLLEALGQEEAAIRSLQRSLQDPNWLNRQRRGLLLAHLAIIAAGADQPALAEDALDQLRSVMEEGSTPALSAFRSRALGEWEYARGRHREAVAALRRAIEQWQDIGSPLHAAAARLRLAEVSLADNDAQAALLELSAAQTLSRRHGLLLLSQRCSDFRQRHAAALEDPS